MTNSPTETWTLSVADESLDDDGFISLWNLLLESHGGDVAATREMAGRLLGFLCKHRCDFIVISSTDAEYLDAWFERDNKLLYDWKPESETVEVLCQRAEVPLAALRLFLRSRKFGPETNYSPKRADRVAWFREDWNVG